MRLILILLSTFAFAVFGQPKFEIIEYTGTVVSLIPGFRFALETIELKTESEDLYFRVSPEFGDQVFSKIKIGQTITLRANVNWSARESLKKSNRKYLAPFTDVVTEIKLDGAWISTMPPERKFSSWDNTWIVKLEQEVLGDYSFNGQKKGVLLKDGMVAYNLFGLRYFSDDENIKPGDFISFAGYTLGPEKGFFYPIDGVVKVYSYIPLKKITGTISAFVNKQNFARIGLVINGFRLSFPADYAKQIESFSNNQNVTIYYSGQEDKKTNLLPSIHALIQNSDTILIQKNFYGDPDGKHEYKPAELNGKITQVIRSGRGRVISLIMGNDCYIEVNPKMVEQLGNQLNRGVTIKVVGDERIKKEGEIYEKDYRIITPRKVVIDDKEFILRK